MNLRLEPSNTVDLISEILRDVGVALLKRAVLVAALTQHFI